MFSPRTSSDAGNEESEALRKMAFNRKKLELKSRCQAMDTDRTGWISADMFLRELAASELTVNAEDTGSLLKSFGRGPHIAYSMALDCIAFQRQSSAVRVNLSSAKSSDVPLPPSQPASPRSSTRPASAIISRRPQSSHPQSPRGVPPSSSIVAQAMRIEQDRTSSSRRSSDQQLRQQQQQQQQQQGPSSPRSAAVDRMLDELKSPELQPQKPISRASGSQQLRPASAVLTRSSMSSQVESLSPNMLQSFDFNPQLSPRSPSAHQSEGPLTVMNEIMSYNESQVSSRPQSAMPSTRSSVPKLAVGTKSTGDSNFLRPRTASPRTAKLSSGSSAFSFAGEMDRYTQQQQPNVTSLTSPRGGWPRPATADSGRSSDSLTGRSSAAQPQRTEKEQFTPLEDDDVNFLRRIFSMLDNTRSGEIPKEEFVKAVKRLNLGDIPIQKLTDRCSTGQTGSNICVRYEDFLNLVRKREEVAATSPVSPKLLKTRSRVSLATIKTTLEDTIAEQAISPLSSDERFEAKQQALVKKNSRSSLKEQHQRAKPSTPALELAAKLRGKVYQAGNIAKMFLFYNKSRTGRLTLEEFTYFCRSYGFMEPPPVIAEVFNYIDKSQNGTIEFNEFSSVVTEDENILASPQASSPLTLAKHMFHGKTGIINENRPQRTIEPPVKSKIQHTAALTGVQIVPTFLSEVVQLRDDLRDKIYQKNALVRTVFLSMDADSSGFIDKEEFRKFVRYFHLRASDETINKLYDTIDTDGSGVLDYAEFTKGLMHDNQQRQPYEMDEEEAKRKFVFLPDCVMFSDVVPPSRPVKRSASTDDRVPPTLSPTVGELRKTMKELRNPFYKKLLMIVRDYDHSQTGVMQRSLLERVLEKNGVAITFEQVQRVLDVYTQNDAVDYRGLIGRMGIMAETEGFDVAVSPLGKNFVPPPFGIHDDEVGGRKQVADNIAVKFERMVKAFQHFDSDRTGYLSYGPFREALQAMKLGLVESEIQEVIRKADPTRNGRIDYETFVKTCFAPSGELPYMMRTQKSRDSGDVIGWTTTPIKSDSFPDRMLRSGAEIVVNENVVMAKPQPESAIPPQTPRSQTSMSGTSGTPKRRTTNPLLAKTDVGTGPPELHRLPHHGRSDFAYGITTPMKEASMSGLLSMQYAHESPVIIRSSSGRPSPRPVTASPRPPMTPRTASRALTRSQLLRNQAIERRMEFMNEVQSGSSTPRSQTSSRLSSRPSLQVLPTGGLTRSPHTGQYVPRSQI